MGNLQSLLLLSLNVFIYLFYYSQDLFINYHVFFSLVLDIKFVVIAIFRDMFFSFFLNVLRIRSNHILIYYFFFSFFFAFFHVL